MSALPVASTRPPDLLRTRTARPFADAACLITAGLLIVAAVIAAVWQRQPWALLPVAIAGLLLGLVALRVRQQGHALRQAEKRAAMRNPGKAETAIAVCVDADLLREMAGVGRFH